MADPTSRTFRSTQLLFDNLMGKILNTSTIVPDLINCSLSTLRPVNQGKDTGVDSVCCYRKTATAPAFDRVKTYHKFINETNGFTKLQNYNLDPKSLFVNDYHEASPPTTVSPTPKPQVATDCFTLNFTTNNLKYRTQMSIPKSKLFSSTQRLFSKLLGDIWKNSDIGPDFINCSLSTLRSVNQGKNTGVDSVCCYRKTATTPPFNRVNIYRKFRTETNGFTKMERFNLDPDSLFVNDYHEASPQTTLSPTSKRAVATECFTVNFTATSLTYRPQMADPTSRIFSSAQRFLVNLFGDIMKKSEVGPDFINCSLSTLRSIHQRKYTGVDSVCCYRKAATAPPFNPINIYQKFVNETNHFTKIGRYNLDPNSLFVNGYSPSTTDSASDLLSYELGFKVINKNLTNKNPLSPEYKQLMGSISNELNQLFHQSSISDGFKICAVTKLRIGSIIVDCKCYFHPSGIISKDTIKNVFQQETQNATSQWLGSRFQIMGFTIEEYPSAMATEPSKQELPYWAIILICFSVLLGSIFFFLLCVLTAVWVKRRAGKYQI
ncbi:PREDICTED: mucin-16-like [Thamnophis sirtalis]|uniref:Mucin-16-like n=1 Tax=Thamnophis sirtalis TaxID=35019 RepID=A0A6I9XKA6_9SAUR|nr:PREDICTED: mucin-16-like [Thamnophis sirtalis]